MRSDVSHRLVSVPQAEPTCEKPTTASFSSAFWERLKADLRQMLRAQKNNTVRFVRGLLREGAERNQLMNEFMELDDVFNGSLSQCTVYDLKPITAREILRIVEEVVDEEEEDDYEEFRVRYPRLYERYRRRRTRLSHRILLGDPHHGLKRCDWAETEVRLAGNGHGYTFCEFEEEHGDWATWCWERCTVLNPVSDIRYTLFREHEMQACHRALLCILRKQNEILIGRKVLTDSRIVRVLLDEVQNRIACFITLDKEAMLSMTYSNSSLENVTLSR